MLGVNYKTSPHRNQVGMTIFLHVLSICFSGTRFIFPTPAKGWSRERWGPVNEALHQGSYWCGLPTFAYSPEIWCSKPASTEGHPHPWWVLTLLSSFLLNTLSLLLGNGEVTLVLPTETFQLSWWYLWLHGSRAIWGQCSPGGILFVRVSVGES
jgi:hypothetical protein